MQHQDWTPRTIGNRSRGAAKKPSGRTVVAARTHAGRNGSVFGHGPMGTTAGQRAGGLEGETESFKVKRISKAVSAAIRDARVNAGMNQKALAMKLNTRATTVQAYESGKAVPVGRIIQQIERACGLDYGSISGKKRKAKKSKKGAKKGKAKL